MRILVFSPFYLPGYKGGGPIKSIKNLFNQTSDKVTYKLITSDRDLGDLSAYADVNCGTWNQLEDVNVFYSQVGVTGLVQMFRILIDKDYDLIYLNSFFSLRFSFYPILLAWIFRRKVVLAPRGEVSSGALAIKSFKKHIFISIFKFLKLHRIVVFQVSTLFEKEDLYCTLGYDVNAYVAEDVASQDFAESLTLRTSNKINAVFISRITPKKNLISALNALHFVKHSLEYHIYGPIEDVHYWHQCESVIKSLPNHITVKHMGSLMPEEVVNTLSKYDVFFFPTKGENYGHVIVEALCAGLPILISDTTPWRNLQSLGIGWDLPLNNPAAFSNVLNELAFLPPEKYLHLRHNVLDWAKNKFSQRDAVEANIAMFKYAFQKDRMHI